VLEVLEFSGFVKAEADGLHSIVCNCFVCLDLCSSCVFRQELVCTVHFYALVGREPGCTLISTSAAPDCAGHYRWHQPHPWDTG